MNNKVQSDRINSKNTRQTLIIHNSLECYIYFIKSQF